MKKRDAAILTLMVFVTGLILTVSLLMIIKKIDTPSGPKVYVTVAAEIPRVEIPTEEIQKWIIEWQEWEYSVDKAVGYGISAVEQARKLTKEDYPLTYQHIQRDAEIVTENSRAATIELEKLKALLDEIKTLNVELSENKSWTLYNRMTEKSKEVDRLAQIIDAKTKTIRMALNRMANIIDAEIQNGNTATAPPIFY